MIRPLFHFARRRIIVDVDTQKDFLLADGGNCIRNHRRVLMNIRRVVSWSRVRNIRIISTMQVASSGNGNGGGNGIPKGTGLEKISYTLRKNNASFTAQTSTDLPRDILRSYDQVIFHKRTADPFDEPRLDRLFSELHADEFIVIGAGTETAIKATVLGLLRRKKKVSIVVDAVGSRDKRQAEFALRQMKAKGAKMIEAKSLVGVTRLRRGCICINVC